MRVIIQRSKKSNVTIDGKLNGFIENGLVLLVGFSKLDCEKTLEKVIDKIINMRIFEDENGLMNKSLIDIKGSILSISQFTLFANIKKGRRPSFIDAMEPTEANKLYLLFNEKVKSKGIELSSGIFGANMLVNINNDGPVTIILDSELL